MFDLEELDAIAGNDIAVVTLEGGNNALGRTDMSCDAAAVRFLERLTLPRPHIDVYYPAAERKLGVYVGNGHEGLMFAGPNASRLFPYARIFHELANGLDVCAHDGNGNEVPFADYEPTAILGRMLCGPNERLTRHESQMFAQEYPKHLDQFIQFVVWVKVVLERRRSMDRPVNELRWLTVTHALEWAQLADREAREKFIGDMRAKILQP